MAWYSKYLTDPFFIQLGHGAGGYGMFITPFAVSPHTSFLKLALIGSAVVLGWTCPKEYAFDPLVEKATLADGWVDQRSYLIGAGLAFVVLLISKL